MGVLVSKDQELQVQKEHSKFIDIEINAQRRANVSIVKLLLLGAAEGGKSTILKQMKILHNDGFTEMEIKLQINVIYWNILMSAVNILKAMKNLGIKFENPERESDETTVHSYIKFKEVQLIMDTEIYSALKKLCNDKGFQACFRRSHEYYLSDSAKYYFDQLDRICEKNYTPNDQDVLRARVATTGITEVKFNLKTAIFRVIDVGGQRSERRKWIHCFADVDSVIFVASLSEYNLTLQEDDKTNRMHESVALFNKICNCKWFLKTAMILFLNKKDVFIEKLKTVPLTIAYPEYEGPQNYEPSAKYIEQKYQSSKQNEEKQIYTHRTCATDTKNIEFVFGACSDIILQSGMKTTGLI